MNVFISYSWTSAKHISWVKKIAKTLLKNGVSVTIDVINLHAGQDINEFILREIKNSDYVLIICDKAYREKADNVGVIESGVGKETMIIRNVVMSDPNQVKYVPLVREYEYIENKPHPCIPYYLTSRLYLDITPEHEETTLKTLIEMFSPKNDKLKLLETTTVFPVRIIGLQCANDEVRILAEAILNTESHFHIMQTELDSKFHVEFINEWKDALKRRHIPVIIGISSNISSQSFMENTMGQIIIVALARNKDLDPECSIKEDEKKIVAYPNWDNYLMDSTKDIAEICRNADHFIRNPLNLSASLTGIFFEQNDVDTKLKFDVFEFPEGLH